MSYVRTNAGLASRDWLHVVARGHRASGVTTRSSDLSFKAGTCQSVALASQAVNLRLERESHAIIPI
jgi:hypothetical protein